VSIELEERDRQGKWIFCSDVNKVTALTVKATILKAKPQRQRSKLGTQPMIKCYQCTTNAYITMANVITFFSLPVGLLPSHDRRDEIILTVFIEIVLVCKLQY